MLYELKMKLKVLIIVFLIRQTISPDNDQIFKNLELNKQSRYAFSEIRYAVCDELENIQRIRSADKSVLSGVMILFSFGQRRINFHWYRLLCCLDQSNSEFN